jgi:hypothetical protein
MLVLRKNKPQKNPKESFPQRWAPALREAKAFLAPSMFTQRHAVAEHVGFVEAAKHCIRRLERLEQGSAALANARFAAVECLIWVGSGDLGHSDWDEEIRIASASSRSDVRDAAAALKQKVLEWKRIEARAAQQENDEPEEDGELAREIATPPREDLSVAKSPAKETPLPAVRKRVSLFSWLLRLAFSGSLIFVLLKYRARVWQWLQAIIAKVKK